MLEQLICEEKIQGNSFFGDLKVKERSHKHFSQCDKSYIWMSWVFIVMSKSIMNTPQH